VVEITRKDTPPCSFPPIHNFQLYLLAILRQLKEQERELRLALFEASLTDEEQQRLEQEARTLVNPNMGLSTARQIEIQKDAILKAWFEQREKDKRLLGVAS